jgi:hypothetical protein
VASLYNVLERLISVGQSRRAAMQDVIFMAVLIVFFTLAGLFVVACDRIIGKDDDALAEGARGAPEPGSATERLAA